jgi:hypothetical protein
MMPCPSCGGTQASSQFGESGIVMVCGNSACGTRWQPKPVEAFVAPSESAPRMVTKPTRVEPEQAKRQPLTPNGIVKQARVELRALDLEIKRLEKLKKQRDELKRLISAATNKRDGLAAVRPIRTQAGR